MTTTTLPPQTARQADMILVADQARQIAAKHGDIRQCNYQDAAPFVILRNKDGGEYPHFLSDRLQHPDRKSGFITVYDADSFILYTRGHHNGSPIFAHPNPAHFLAVLNDHEFDADGANYRDFRVKLELKFSDEWVAWNNHNGSGKAFPSTEAFAEFLELNAPDIIEPDAAKFMELALNFHVNESVSYSKIQRLSDGHVQLSYNQIVDSATPGGSGGIIKMPTKFTIEVPVFRTLVDDGYSGRYKCEAHFRYRMREGRVTIWYDLVRPAKVVEKAFADMWRKIAAEVGTPVLYGVAP